jgi:hypothetical protein
MQVCGIMRPVGLILLSLFSFKGAKVSFPKSWGTKKGAYSKWSYEKEGTAELVVCSPLGVGQVGEQLQLTIFLLIMECDKD